MSVPSEVAGERIAASSSESGIGTPESHRDTAQRYLWIALVVAIGVFAIDVWIHVGIATPIGYIAVGNVTIGSIAVAYIAVAYIAVVYLVSLAGRRRQVLGAAAATTVLTIVAWILSTAAWFDWATIENRLLSLFAIGLTTLFCHRELSQREQNQRLVASLKDERSKLLVSEGRTRSLFNSAMDAVITFDRDGIVDQWNQQAETIFGYTMLESSGRPLIDLVAPLNRYQSYQRLLDYFVANAKRPIRNRHLEIAARRRDGSTFSVEISVVPVPRADGNWFCLFARDITERKQLEVARRQLNQRLRDSVVAKDADLVSARDRLNMALTSANVGLWDWNAQTNKVYYSPTYKTQLGFPSDTHWDTFESWRSRLHPDDEAKTLACIDQYFQQRRGDYQTTFRMCCKDGTYRWILAQGRATFGPDGEPVRVLGVHIDVSDQVRSEEKLRQLNDALKKANQALEASNTELQQFAYVASHDLQAPLRAVVGFAQLLETDYCDRLDPRGEDYVQRIVAASRRMQQLINDLLRYSRVQSSDLTNASVPLDDALVDAIGLLESQIANSGAIVTSDPLPTISGDPSQWSQMLTNLIGNSIKYCDQTPRIHVSADRGHNAWMIRVRDNGIGIAKEDQQRVFEVFRRLHPQHRYPGNGIGLAICQRIAQRHGGSISAASNDGVGSTFLIDIPDNTDDSN
ncbi:Phytochrome-like protein cph1 [Rubripirellula lacrimiformis]|uniref:histidine kinase n=1 Tax=Rubripirellula lacrimiformis TaxID=1930273 RepID=A0A517NDV0_9BACT|nr:PAS domain S-box protein [Rubripirellula lacrimiformis]QDT05309.1 Phytochrome-like protein cph1 [Rubripirellula lacrimiformis]